MALTKDYLLQKLWESCTFEEILVKGLEKGCIDPGSIIDATKMYENPNKEYTDEEIIDIVQNADLTVVLDAIIDKYDIKDIIDKLDKYDVLYCYDTDDLIEYCSFELEDKYEEERRAGYDDGYEEGWNDALTPPKNILNDGSGDARWKYFCDELGIGYYDENRLKEKLNDVLSSFDKTVYKKSSESWKI